MNLDFMAIENTYQVWQHYQSTIDAAFWEGLSDATRLEVLSAHSHPEMDHLIKVMMGGQNLPDLHVMSILDKAAFIGQFFDEHPDAKLEPRDPTRTCYRITGIFRMDLKEGKRHVVDSNWNWTLQDAQQRMADIQKQSQWEMDNRKRKAQACGGGFSVGTEYHSDFDLLALRIESRKVTSWTKVEGGD